MFVESKVSHLKNLDFWWFLLLFLKRNSLSSELIDSDADIPIYLADLFKVNNNILLIECILEIENGKAKNKNNHQLEFE